MTLVIIIGVPIFILYTVVVLAIGDYRGYNSGFNDAMMIFLANESAESEEPE